MSPEPGLRWVGLPVAHATIAPDVIISFRMSSCIVCLPSEVNISTRLSNQRRLRFNGTPAQRKLPFNLPFP